MKSKTEVKCPICDSENVSSNGKQRWRCNNCAKQWMKHKIIPATYTPDKEEDSVAAKHYEQILNLMKRDPIPVNQYYGDIIRFGVISDTHLGSRFERLDLLDLAYNIYHKEKITTVYHPGDICEGENMHPGQTYEIHRHGSDAQVEWCVEKYPKVPGITTYFITGSHDLSFWKRSGIDIGIQIAQKRPDMIYLGREEADIFVKSPKGKIILRMVHPGGGTAYAISYHVQKYIESLSGGQKPNVLLVGHYHKAEYLPCYRNVFALQPGCIQAQTSFMRRYKLSSHMGFWIVEMKILGNSVTSFSPEFFAHYEENIIFDTNDHDGRIIEKDRERKAA